MESDHANEKNQLNEQISQLTKTNSESNVEFEKTKEKLTQVCFVCITLEWKQSTLLYCIFEAIILTKLLSQKIYQNAWNYCT